jgi:hypothetical protein
MSHVRVPGENAGKPTKHPVTGMPNSLKALGRPSMLLSEPWVRNARKKRVLKSPAPPAPKRRP